MQYTQVELAALWPSARAEVERLAAEAGALASVVSKCLVMRERGPVGLFYATQSRPVRWLVALYLPPLSLNLGSTPRLLWARGPTLRGALGQLDSTVRIAKVHWRREVS